MSRRIGPSRRLRSARSALTRSRSALTASRSPGALGGACAQTGETTSASIATAAGTGVLMRTTAQVSNNRSMTHDERFTGSARSSTARR